MGPEKRTFRLPLIRLGASMIAIFIVGDVFVNAFRSAVASIQQDSEESVDSSSRRKKRLERPLSRALDRVPELLASASSIGEEKMGGRVHRWILSKITTSEGKGMFPAGSAVEELETLELEAAPFVWPAPLGVPVGPESIPPNAAGSLEWANLRAELVTEVYRRCGSDPLADVFDTLLRGPEILFDGAFTSVGCLSGRSSLRTREDEESRSVTERVLDIQPGARPQGLFATFMQQWTVREQRYLAAFDESRANTYGFQNRTEGADMGELALDQRKIALDALRRTYLSRYKMNSEEQIPEEAWCFGRWSGIDFAVLPPIIGAFLFYCGLNKKISMGDTALRVSIEPVTEFIHRKRERSMATALEWTVKGFPVGVIVSAGFHDGLYRMDFVGIGTSIGVVRRTVDLEHEELRR